MAGWIDVCSIEEIPRRGARVVCTGVGQVAIFRNGGDGFFALLDRCPHRGGPLSQGIVHGGRVTCPLHDWVVDLATGAAVAPDEGMTETFPVRVEAGRIWLGLDGADAGQVVLHPLKACVP